MAADLDDAAVAGAVSAGHRRLPGELRARDEHRERLEHRLGTAGENVSGVLRQEIGHEPRLDRHVGLREQRGRSRVLVAPEAEQRRRMAQRLGEIGQRRDPDSAADEQRALDREIEAVAERAEHVDRVARGERAERACPGADRVDEERELPFRREAEAHRAREHAPRGLEHEELPGSPGLETAPLDAEERVRPDGVASRARTAAREPAAR